MIFSISIPLSCGTEGIALSNCIGCWRPSMSQTLGKALCDGLGGFHVFCRTFGTYTHRVLVPFVFALASHPLLNLYSRQAKSGCLGQKYSLIPVAKPNGKTESKRCDPEPVTVAGRMACRKSCTHSEPFGTEYGFLLLAQIESGQGIRTFWSNKNAPVSTFSGGEPWASRNTNMSRFSFWTYANHGRPLNNKPVRRDCAEEGIVFRNVGKALEGVFAWICSSRAPSKTEPSCRCVPEFHARIIHKST